MMKINVVAVGKVKEKYFKDGIEEYSKRLSRFCSFNIIELPEENYVKVNPSVIDDIKKKEAENILPHLKGKVFLTAIEGKILSSEEFAEKIRNVKDCGEGVITFVIGGSYGLDKSVKEKGELVSFSKMTFPHTLFRLILTEQIYRAFTILEGTLYHK